MQKVTTIAEEVQDMIIIKILCDLFLAIQEVCKGRFISKEEENS